MTVHVLAACPRCGAHVRPGADWCTLCYADLRPAPVPVVEPMDVDAMDVEPVVDEVVGTAEPSVPTETPRPVGGKHARRAPAGEPAPAAAQPAAGAEAVLEIVVPGADAMLAQLAVESRGSLEGLGARLGSSKKVAIMLGGVVVVGLLLFGLMAAVGSLL